MQKKCHFMKNSEGDTFFFLHISTLSVLFVISFELLYPFQESHIYWENNLFLIVHSKHLYVYNMNMLFEIL